MAPDNTRPDTKGDTAAIESPTKQQIDLVFASLVDAVDGEVDGPLADGVVNLIVTQWTTARELQEQDALSPGEIDVEAVAEEWL